MKYTYWAVFETNPGENDTKEKRRIYTFNNENAAHDMVEFILRNDLCDPRIHVEEVEYETSA